MVHSVLVVKGHVSPNIQSIIPTIPGEINHENQREEHEVHVNHDGMGHELEFGEAKQSNTGVNVIIYTIIVSTNINRR